MGREGVSADGSDPAEEQSPQSEEDSPECRGQKACSENPREANMGRMVALSLLSFKSHLEV